MVVREEGVVGGRASEEPGGPSPCPGAARGQATPTYGEVAWWPPGSSQVAFCPFCVKTSNINFSGFFEKLYFSDFFRILINNNKAGKTKINEGKHSGNKDKFG